MNPNTEEHEELIENLQKYNNGFGTGKLRRFDTGATRNDDHDKIDFSRCLSPLAIGAFGAYMHKERNLPDGTVRAPDDWKKGIPLDSYMSSMWRHLFCVWSIHDGYSNEDKIEALCGLMFNVQGMLHETIKHQTDDKWEHSIWKRPVTSPPTISSIYGGERTDWCSYLKLLLLTALMAFFVTTSIIWFQFIHTEKLSQQAEMGQPRQGTTTIDKIKNYR